MKGLTCKLESLLWGLDATVRVMCDHNERRAPLRPMWIKGITTSTLLYTCAERVLHDDALEELLTPLKQLC